MGVIGTAGTVWCLTMNTWADMKGSDRFVDAELYHGGEDTEWGTVERFTRPDEFLSILYDVSGLEFDTCVISIGFAEIDRIELPVAP